MATGRITVVNTTNANNVEYWIGGQVPGSGAQGLASGRLGNPSSGTYKETIPVSGYEFYDVSFSPVGTNGMPAYVPDVTVQEGGDPTEVRLALTVE